MLRGFRFGNLKSMAFIGRRQTTLGHYSVIGSGINSRGNRWCAFDHGPVAPCRFTYIYYNSDGSCVYVNPDGSKIIYDPAGSARYIPPKKDQIKPSQPINSAVDDKGSRCAKGKKVN